MAPVGPAERGPKPAGTGRPSYALRITQVTIQERGQALVFDLVACRRLDSGECLVGAPGAQAAALAAEQILLRSGISAGAPSCISHPTWRSYLVGGAFRSSHRRGLRSSAVEALPARPTGEGADMGEAWTRMWAGTGFVKCSRAGRS